MESDEQAREFLVADATAELAVQHVGGGLPKWVSVDFLNHFCQLTASGDEEDFAGEVVQDHVALGKLARVHRLGVMPRLGPLR